MVNGVFLTYLVFRQKRTDAQLYPNWCNVTKYETVRLEAIWERIDVASLPDQEPGWLKKWQKELKKAIKQSIKSNKKEYLPIIYLMALFCRKT